MMNMSSPCGFFFGMIQAVGLVRVPVVVRGKSKAIGGQSFITFLLCLAISISRTQSFIITPTLLSSPSSLSLLSSSPFFSIQYQRTTSTIASPPSSSLKYGSKIPNVIMSMSANIDYNTDADADADADQVELPLKTYQDYKDKLEAIAFLSSLGIDDNEDLCHEGQSIFDKMFDQWYINEKDDLEPSTDIYNLLIEIYSYSNKGSGSGSVSGSGSSGSGSNNMMKIPEQILTKMENGADDNVPPPNLQTYISIMNGHVRSNNMKQIEVTLQRLEDRYDEQIKTNVDGVDDNVDSDDDDDSDDDNDHGHDEDILLLRPTIEVYNTVLSAWLKSGLKIAPKKAEDMLYKLMDHRRRNGNGNGNLGAAVAGAAARPNTKTFYLVMSCFVRDNTMPKSKKATKVDELMELMNDWKKNFDDDSDDRSDASVDENGDANADVDAEMGVDPNHKNIKNIQIKLSKTAIDAETILFDMIDLYQKDGNMNHRPNAASFINTINVWKDCKTNEAPTRSLQLLDLLTEIHDLEQQKESENMDTDTESNTDTESDTEYDTETKVNDLKPDKRVYNAVQNVWSRSREPDKANETRKLLLTLLSKYESTKDMDYAPTTRQFNNVINACVYTKGNAQLKKEAMKVLVMTFNEMRNTKTNKGVDEDENDDDGNDDDDEGMNHVMNIEPNHVTYGMFLKGCDMLLPKGKGNAKQQKEGIIEKVFRKCCREGYVSEFVFTTFVEASSIELSRKLLGGDVYGEDGIQIPEEWTRNVD